jgi:hypothetical protein
MKSYKFKDYVLLKEVFDLPNHRELSGGSGISTILHKLNPHDIVEFCLHVAEDALQFAGEDANIVQNSIKRVQTWLQHPTLDTADAAYTATVTAPNEEHNPAVNAAHAAALAAYLAQSLIDHHTSERPSLAVGQQALANQGAMAATSAAMAAYHNSNDDIRNPNKVYDKTLAKYKSWASAYHANPTQSHVNKQEIAKLMDRDGDHLPYLLDYLEENNIKPSNLTLQQFGVKDFSSNKEIAQQILESGMLSGFYRAISNALAKVI